MYIQEYKIQKVASSARLYSPLFDTKDASNARCLHDIIGVGMHHGGVENKRWETREEWFRLYHALEYTEHGFDQGWDLGIRMGIIIPRTVYKVEE